MHHAPGLRTSALASLTALTLAVPVALATPAHASPSVAATLTTTHGTVLPTAPVSSGWQSENGRWRYYVGGQAVTSWYQVGGSWYYFAADGTMLTGWQRSGSTWYYLRPSGEMATGWQQVGSAWYYLGTDGAMQAGRWLQQGATWYYLNTSGTAAANQWVPSGGSWYYLGTDGAMQAGRWLQQGGTWYYLNTDGTMAHDQWVGNTYLLSNGAMATGRQQIGSQTYRFNASGTAVAATSGTWTCPSWAPIKGNADSGIYHVPGGRYYSDTKAEECFVSRGDAENAGYRASKV